MSQNTEYERVEVELADLRIVLRGLADPNPRPSMKQMVQRKEAEDRIRSTLGDAWDWRTGRWVEATQIDRSGTEDV